MNISIKNAGINIPVMNSDQKRIFTKSYIQTALGGKLVSNKKNTFVEALKNINFEAKSGDKIGIVGVNGSGKTTLLRMIAGIYTPSYGEVSVNGKVIPLIDQSFGMDYDATGYENIEIGCIFSGFSARETKDLIPQIAAFTELREFLAMPIRTYSAGMVARLSFGIATASVPEILVVDEGLGAGDKDFHQKAKDRLEFFLAQSGILIMASHSIDLLKTYCNKGLYLHKGEIVDFDRINIIISKYMN